MYNPGPADSAPFGPSFSPQPNVYPQPFDFARPLFSYTYELPLPIDRFARPLFSWSYKLPFPQIFYFHNDLRCPIVFRLPSNRAPSPSTPIDLYAFCFLALINPFFVNPFIFTSIQIPGGGGSAPHVRSAKLMNR